MPNLQSILHEYWGHTQFRPLQEDIIRSVLSGKDTLALLPTGGGKSVCFQVPALHLDGLCLVVSPLIALMKDQVANLKAKGIRAAALYSGMNTAEIEITLDNCISGGYKFLYVSPERLQSRRLLERIPNLNISFLAVDEAHCISQWGYDFRPPYRKIKSLRELLPGKTVLALTASAPPEVQADICRQLGFQENNSAVFTASFARPNISYLVRKEENKRDHILKVLRHVPGTSIVYVRSRRGCAELAAFLQKNGIASDYYHAGLNQKERDKKQANWKSGACRVIVATNAFGMGIDKADVRSVIHVDVPDDPESYYQEAGRAGRDGKPCYAVLLYSDADIIQLENRGKENFPEKEEVIRVYNSIFNYLGLALGSGTDESFHFEINEFCTRFRLEPLLTYRCMKVLEMEGLLQLSEAIFLPSRVMLLLSDTDLYNFTVQHIQFDPLVKTLLRSYSNLFDEYVRINEKDIARRMEISEDVVKSQLDFLHQAEIISYLPMSDKPLLTLLTGRIAPEQVKLSYESLEGRKERFVQRAMVMKEFCTGQHQCRSMILLDYFGERNHTRCGFCDTCRKRNQVALNDISLEHAEQEIIRILRNGPIEYSALLAAFDRAHETEIDQVLRWMRDQGKIDLLDDGSFTLNRNETKAKGIP